MAEQERFTIKSESNISYDDWMEYIYYLIDLSLRTFVGTGKMVNHV